MGELLGLPGAADPADHTGLFLLALPPYASVYLGSEGMLGGEARDRVAGYWRATGRVPPPEPDHLAALLGLYASLGEEGAGAAAVSYAGVRDSRAPGRSGSSRSRPAGGDRAREEPGTGHGEAARRLLRERARAALLREHLLPWLGPYLAKAEEIASPFYRGWARLLRESLLREAAAPGREAGTSGRETGTSGRRAGTAGREAGAGGLEAGASSLEASAAAPSAPFPPEGLPLHLRVAPPVRDPSSSVGSPASPAALPASSGAPSTEGEMGFVAQLLAPVRSGMLLVRADLERAGRSAGLGVRMGERAYALRQLFAQDPAATLAWLAEEARSWERRHPRVWGVPEAPPEVDPGVVAAGGGPLALVTAWWAGRARATADLLERLAAGPF